MTCDSKRLTFFYITEIDQSVLLSRLVSYNPNLFHWYQKKLFLAGTPHICWLQWKKHRSTTSLLPYALPANENNILSFHAKVNNNIYALYGYASKIKVLFKLKLSSSSLYPVHQAFYKKRLTSRALYSFTANTNINISYCCIFTLRAFHCQITNWLEQNNGQ